MDLSNAKIIKIAKKAGGLLNQGYHCSEAMLLVVGTELLDELDPQAIKMSTPFAGGIACAYDDLCGALTGGIMVIGGLYGRADAKKSDSRCLSVAKHYREAFLQEFGWLNCCDLRERWRGKPGQEDCAELVEKAAALLLAILSEE
jgi:C_GCAxxG_C_C family probable redox protein